MRAIFVLIILCLLGGCKSSSLDFNKDYPMMKDVSHVYQKVDFAVAYDLFTEGTGVILLGFDSNKYYCPYCHTVIPLLNEVASEVNYPKIYYLDIYDMRMKKTKDYQSLLDLIDSQIDDLLIKDDELTLVVPDVYFIKDGVIKGHHIATIYDDENNFIINLNEEEQNVLKDIYKNLFSLIN